MFDNNPRHAQNLTNAATVNTLLLPPTFPPDKPFRLRARQFLAVIVRCRGMHLILHLLLR